MIDSDSLEEVSRSEPIDELLCIAVDPTGRYLYGTAVVADGRVHSWRIAGDRLVSLGDPVSSGGSEPCHLLVHPDGYLLVANYGSAEAGSIAALLIAPDGSVGPASVLARQTAPGPDPDRQGESHIHQIVAGEDGEVLVVDLGADEIISFLLECGGLVDPVVSPVPSGAGPRHLLLLRSGDIAVSGELGSTLLRARRAQRRFVDWVATASTGSPLPPGITNYPSDLQPGPDPDVLYLANRGADTVAALSISSGRIVAERPCGASPRQLAVAGELIYVAGTNSDEVNVLDARTLLPARPPIKVARPMCVVVVGVPAAGPAL